MKDKLLYSTLLKLRPLDGQPQPDPHSYRGLSMVLVLLGERHPAMAESLHRDTQDKPLTVSPLLRPKRGEEDWSLRLTMLEEEPFCALAESVLAWDPGRPLTLGNGQYSLKGLEATPGSDPRVACTNFRQLAESAQSGERRWRLDFLTPTSFRSKGGYSQFPAVALVFGSLARRWSRFSPAPLPPGLTAALSESITVAEYRIGLSRLGFGRYFEPGFTGWCAFSASKRADDETCRWAGALARFAFFSGVGAKTTMGMGQTRFHDGGGGS